MTEEEVLETIDSYVATIDKDEFKITKLKQLLLKAIVCESDSLIKEMRDVINKQMED